MQIRNLPILFVMIMSMAIGSCTSDGNPLNTFSGANFTLLDSNSKGGVCMFIAPDCPLSQSYVKTFADLANRYGNDLHFFGALPGTHYTRKEVEHFIDSFDFNLPLVLDRDFQLTKKWKATVTPEFIFVDSSTNVVYSGAIDNWAIGLAKKRIEPSAFYLQDALKAYLNSEPITISRTKPVGCYIEGID